MIKHVNHILFACGIVLALSSACSKQTPGSAVDNSQAPNTEPAAVQAPALEAAPVSAAEAQKLYKSRCVVCHGDSGKGDGPGAAALTPKPRDYSDAEWQKTVSDEDIKNVIVMGGAAIGKSPAMPGNPDLESKPEMVLGLVKLIRSHAAK